MGDGGTAADAVIAANAVLGMVLPTTCGIGGDFFAIVHEPGWSQPQVLNASGRGGSGLDPASMRQAGFTHMPPYGPESVSVPGCVDGWEALHSRHGRFDLGDVLKPAIELGSAGFEVSLELSEDLKRLEPALSGQPSAAALYPHGAPPEPASRITRPDLASTLEAIAHSGRNAFYEGVVADAVVNATNGVLSRSDLASNTVDWVEPLGLDVFGHTAWTIPPNSQGYLTLATAWIFEQLGVPSDPDDPAFHHALIEAYRSMAWERNDTVADPDHLPWALSHYLDADRLRERTSAIDLTEVAEWPQPTPGPPGTAFFCAVDANGQAVSCIQSNYFGIGSRISAASTGVFLHNRGAGFSLIEGHANEAGAGKRPLHTLAPTLWTRDGSLALVLGTRGGDQQPQYLAQVAAALLYNGDSPLQAQSRPRWNIAADGLSESVVLVEPGMPEEVVSGLEGFGHTVVPGPARTPGWGPVSIIAVDSTGTRSAAADPRVTTATAGGE
jgi:gamma-glutamyltranspeptidase/glutathione hydrolase